jgi:hypothetical protein
MAHFCWHCFKNITSFSKAEMEMSLFSVSTSLSGCHRGHAISHIQTAIRPQFIKRYDSGRHVRSMLRCTCLLFLGLLLLLAQQKILMLRVLSHIWPLDGNNGCFICSVLLTRSFPTPDDICQWQSQIDAL